MSETCGDIMDKHWNACAKLWFTVQRGYDFADMSTEEYASLPPQETHEVFKRLKSLNLTRGELVGEFDRKLGEAIRNGKAPETPRVKIT